MSVSLKNVFDKAVKIINFGKSQLSSRCLFNTFVKQNVNQPLLYTAVCTGVISRESI